MTASDLTVTAAARIMREAIRDKSYRAFPMGGEAGHYLRWKRGRLTKSSYRDYESCLDKLARFFPDLGLSDFEPPVGVERLEEFLDHQWGERENRTYNKNVSVLGDFFKWAVLKGKLHGNPALPLQRRKNRDVHREIFNDATRTRILADGPHPDHLFRDRCCLRLLLKYGLRKGALRAIQFKHFDHHRRRLTVFTKGEKIRELPIVDEGFWDDLGRLIIDTQAEPHHFLLPWNRTVFWKYDPHGVKLFREAVHPDRQIGDHGAHNWWYRCLARAGVVEPGTTSGEKMHKARHTAGQAVLDATGNLKATQMLLGHSDIGTTGNTYTDWDIGRLEETMRGVPE